MQISCKYEQAIATKYPEQVAIAIVKDPQGKHNPITLGWTMLTSHHPPMMAISIGLTRYSLEAIRHAREFVISFPTPAMASETLLFGTKSGRDTDKLAESGVKTQPAMEIDGVLLTDAGANFECRVVTEVKTGDHVLFVGEVVAAHRNEADRMPRLYSLGDNRLGGVVPG